MTDCDKCKEYDKEKNYCPVFCNVINDTLTDKAIEELEKIKEEIEKKYPYTLSFNLPKKKIVTDCIDILDNHIKELKGVKQ